MCQECFLLQIKYNYHWTCSTGKGIYHDSYSYCSVLKSPLNWYQLTFTLFRIYLFLWGQASEASPSVPAAEPYVGAKIKGV